MVGSLVSVVLSPQLEHNVTLRALPADILAFYPEMNRILVPRHVPLLPKEFLAQVTGPRLQLVVDSLLVTL